MLRSRARYALHIWVLLLAAGLGCSDSANGVTDKGTLGIVVTGLTGAAANGGSATVSPLDVPTAPVVTVSLPASGTGSAEVGVGRYRVSYQAPAGFAVAQGVPN